MRTIIFCIIVVFSYGICKAQTKVDAVTVQLEKLEKQKEEISREEEQALRAEVEEINIRLQEGEISEEEAEGLKKETAKKHALNTENRVAIIDNKIEWLQKEEQEEEEWREGDRGHSISGKKRYDQRTYMNLIVAAGFNNAWQEGQSIDDLDFKLAGSRFFEIGLDWRTRVFYNSDWLRLRYGFSFQFNGLKPTDNRYFVEQENLTVLQEYPLDLNKSKFRMDNLVFPVHLEFGPSKRIETSRRVRFSSAKQLKIGVGGYAGFNIGERQKLKYREGGERVKEKLKSDYNTNDFIYGLSGYLGWSSAALYVKYDLNPVFEEPNSELHNVSVGVRFSLD